MLAPLVHATPEAVGQPAEPEVPKPSLPQVFHGQLGHRAVVDFDQRQPQVADRRAEIHHRHAEPHHQLGALAVADPGQDAVAFPTPQPGRGRIVQAVRLKVERPPRVLAVILGHAAQQPPAVGP